MIVLLLETAAFAPGQVRVTGGNCQAIDENS